MRRPLEIRLLPGGRQVIDPQREKALRESWKATLNGLGFQGSGAEKQAPFGGKPPFKEKGNCDEETKIQTSAEDVLGAREKLEKALRAEEGHLGELVAERAAAEKNLAETETAVAIGERGDTGSAERRVESAVSAIARQGVKLGALRARIAEQAAELEAAHSAIAAALPQHRKHQKQVRGMGEVARSLGCGDGQRQAIERLIG